MISEQWDLGQICRYLDFPEEAIRALSAVEQEIAKNREAQIRLDRATDALFIEGSREFEREGEEAAKIAGVDRKSADMLMLLRGLPRLAANYRAAGIDEGIFRDTAHDLLWKLRECRACFGVWGTFVTSWFPGFYRMTRFAVGRLQYEPIGFPFDEYEGLRKGDIVYNCHIPSSGPLTEEAVEDSLRCAAKFYGCADGIFPVFCSSWLLYPPMAEAVYPEGSNLEKFYRRFTILSEEKDEKCGDFWRVFHRFYSEEALKGAAEDTALQRNLKKFLSDGGHMGHGRGVILYRASCGQMKE